jgi:hypothetical protein
MTPLDVEALFGGPPANYSGKTPDRLAFYQAIRKEMRPGWTSGGQWFPAPYKPPDCKMWVGEELAVLVVFRDGRADEWRSESVADQTVPLFDRLRRLLPW